MKKILYVFVLLIISLISCERNESIIDTMNNNIQITDNSLLIKKVRKLENPYSVTNMKKAYAELQKEGLMKSPMDIETTHLYVRFLPKDSAELETLDNDTTLTLFSYPLDYELTEGERYIDSTLIGNKFTWLYTRVPVNYVSPVSGYEIIEQLYLPTTDNGSQGVKQQKVKSEFLTNWQLLEAKSLELTGYGEKYSPTLSKVIQKATTANWWPEATIRVYDDVTNTYIPLQGVKVRGRWWFNWEDGTTNSHGWTQLSGSFGGKVNWSIVWEGDDWDIRSGFYGQAYYNGPTTNRADWYLDIDKTGGKSFIYGHVHRACYDYWHNYFGLKIPFKNNFWKQKIKIGVYDHDGRSSTGVGWRWVLGSIIQIYQYGKYSDGTEFENKSVNLYKTTIHELAHVSHWDMGNPAYVMADDRLTESYAVGIAYVFSKK